jgi:hypothetical protein
MQPANDEEEVTWNIRRPNQDAVCAVLILNGTELFIKAVYHYHGATDGNQKIQIIARNAQPIIPCDECGAKPAAQICGECQWEDKGWLCAECSQSHECDDEMFLPVVNSPRTGVCGYTGE